MLAPLASSDALEVGLWALEASLYRQQLPAMEAVPVVGSDDTG